MNIHKAISAPLPPIPKSVGSLSCMGPSFEEREEVGSRNLKHTFSYNVMGRKPLPPSLPTSYLCLPNKRTNLGFGISGKGHIIGNYSVNSSSLHAELGVQGGAQRPPQHSFQHLAQLFFGGAREKASALFFYF